MNSGLMKSGSIAATVFLWLLILVSACKHETPYFCCTDPGTCHGEGLDNAVACEDPARSFCDNHGRFSASQASGRTCIAEPGNGACDDGADCLTPEAPRCDLAVTQLCAGCTAESDCAGFPGRARCSTTSGACVECRTGADCPSDRPQCGPEGMCRGCTTNVECSSQLCNMTIGSCVAEDEVVYVGMGGAGPSCTRVAPCGSIQAGVNAVTATRTNILVSGGIYTERVVVNGQSFYLAGPGAELHAPAGTGSVLSIMGTGTVDISDIEIVGSLPSVGPGVACGGTPDTAVSLRRVTIREHTGLGIDSQGCRLTVTGSTIAGNLDGGVQVANGDVVFLNNVVHGNGRSASTVGGLYLDLPTTARVDFNTFVDNDVNGTLPASIRCTAALPITLRNNIVTSGSATEVETGGSCGYAYTLSPVAIAGTGNLAAAPAFIDELNDDYHLLPTSPGVDDADPAATEPIDIDGDTRPQGARADIGADEVVP